MVEARKLEDRKLEEEILLVGRRLLLLFVEPLLCDDEDKGTRTIVANGGVKG